MVASANKYRRGFSLIELMVSLAIGVVMTFGVVNLFLQSKTSFLQDEEIARMQENGRFALRLLSRELAMAGFFGGLVDMDDISTALTITTSSDCGTGMLATGTAVEHTNDAVSASINDTHKCLTNNQLQTGTDVILVRRTLDTPHMTDGTESTSLENNTVYLRVADYGASATLIKGSSFSAGDKTAGSTVDAWEYRPILFALRNFSQTSTDGIPSLCREVLTTTSASVAPTGDCLVEGIEAMHVEFGLDTDDPLDYEVDIYDAAPSVAELATVITARIYVLARSINTVPNYTNDKTYTMGSTSITANDSFYRRMFETTVVMHNSEAFGT